MPLRSLTDASRCLPAAPAEIDSEEEVPELEEVKAPEGEAAAEGEDGEGGKKQSRAEKKARKVRGPSTCVATAVDLCVWRARRHVCRGPSLRR